MDEEEEQSPLDELDELVEDLAFETAHRLDWVTLVRRNFPALTPQQETIVRDMGAAFAADQLLHRALDGSVLRPEDRRFVQETVLLLAQRYGEPLDPRLQQVLEDFAAGKLKVE